MKNISLSAYLHADHILLLPEISSKKRVFEILGELLTKNLDGLDPNQVQAPKQSSAMTLPSALTATQ